MSAILAVLLALGALSGGSDNQEITGRDIAKMIVLACLAAGLWYMYGQAMAYAAVQP